MWSKSPQKFVALSLFFAAVFAACSDDPAPSGDASVRDDAGVSDSGTTDSGIVEPPPILSRTVDRRYACSAERGVTDHSPRSWPGGSPVHSLVDTATGAYFVRFEQTTDPFLPNDRQLIVSTIDRSATFGPAHPIPVPQDEGNFLVTARDNNNGFVVAWSQRDGVHFAGYDQLGAVKIAPKLLPTATGTTSQIAITPRPAGGFALLFARRLDFDAAPSLYFLAIDANGNEVAPANLVVEGNELYRELGQKIVALDDGYLIIWRDTRVAQRTEIYSARLDLQGNLQGTPKEISGAGGRGMSSGGGVGFAADALALIRRGNGAVTAWTEAFTPDFTGTGEEKAWALIRVAELDSNGALVSAAIRLQASEDDIDNVEPTLLRYAGGVLALLWGRGDHIYICAGCVPNHATRLVLLDENTLDPLSDVAEIPRPASGGQLDRSAVVLGGEILVTFRLTFHVHSVAASALFGCNQP